MKRGKEDKAADRRDQARIAAEMLKSMGERPGDEDPEGQASWDSVAATALDDDDDGTAGDTEASEREPEPRGYDVGRMNEEFALAIAGAQAVIVQKIEHPTTNERFRFLRMEAFRALYANRFTEVRGRDGKIKALTWADRWLTDRDRREYQGLIFWPDRELDAGPAKLLNLWQGFSVEPRPGGSYAVFKDHLQTNICGGNEDHFRWLWGWFANMVQRPREKPGTAIVLRGGQGCGKTTVGQVFGSLISQHFHLVDDPRFVTGNFNSHMAHCLLLQADEAMWAGDKSAEGRLKGLITADSQLIEFKGVDAQRQPNFVRIFMTTNHDWAVPAGPDERRFAVFDVEGHAAGNHGYFAELHGELEAGGREALLHDLLAFDLASVNLRDIPKTAALLDQKMHSLDPVEEWLRDRLAAASPVRGRDGWPDSIESEALYDDFIRSAERIGIRRKAGQTAFGMKIKKLLPGVGKGRDTVIGEDGVQRRVWVYRLPPLKVCRDAFADRLGQAIEWVGGDD